MGDGRELTDQVGRESHGGLVGEPRRIAEVVSERSVGRVVLGLVVRDGERLGHGGGPLRVGEGHEGGGVQLRVIVVVSAVDDPVPVGDHPLAVLRDEPREIGRSALMWEQALAQLPMEGSRRGAVRVGAPASQALCHPLVDGVGDDVERDVLVERVGELEVAAGEGQPFEVPFHVHLLAGDHVSPFDLHLGPRRIDVHQLGAELRRLSSARKSGVALDDRGVGRRGRPLVEPERSHHGWLRFLLRAAGADQREGGQPSDDLVQRGGTEAGRHQAEELTHTWVPAPGALGRVRGLTMGDGGHTVGSAWLPNGRLRTRTRPRAGSRKEFLHA